MASLRPTLFVMLLTIPGAAGAATYYVSPNGSNGNNGTSPNTPWLTVRYCVDRLLAAGDICYLTNGIYTQTGILPIRHSGVKLLAYPGHAPVVQWPVVTDETFDNGPGKAYKIQILQGSGWGVPIRDVEIAGITFRYGYLGMHVFQCLNCSIHNNTFDDQYGSCILGNGLNWTIQRNLCINAGTVKVADGRAAAHGFYVQGNGTKILDNLIIRATSFGLTIKSEVFDPAHHPTADYAYARNSIIAGNTFAYGQYFSAIVVWRNEVDNLRVENNIFYENAQNSPSYPNGIHWISASGNTGITVRNNLHYASGSGGTVLFGANGSPTVTSSDNRSASPAFVAGGSNSLPVNWDFSLTSASPAIGMARVNEFPNNTTLAVGAFKTVPAPTASITANQITLTFPMNTAVPIQNLSTTGVTVACTGIACPNAPTVSAVSRVVGTDTKVAVVVSGIKGNACEAANQTWTVSYNATNGTWTGNDSIGAYLNRGRHQKIFSFTNVFATNQCTDKAKSPPSPPAMLKVI